VLLLSTSANQPLSWTTRTLIDGVKADEYSYPTLVEVAQGSTLHGLPPDVWLSYTHMRKAIAFKQLRSNCSARLARSQP
jgi:predicted neuraminidase